MIDKLTVAAMHQLYRSFRDGVQFEVPEIHGYERVIWLLTVAIYAVGDTASTIISLELGGSESTVFIAALLPKYGYGVLVVHKLAMLGIIGLVWYLPTIPAQLLNVDPQPYRSVLVAMFLLRGVYLVVWNAYVIWLLLTVESPVATPPL